MPGTHLVLDSGPLIVLADKTQPRRGLSWLEAIRQRNIIGVVPAGVATEFLRGAPDWHRAVWWLSRLQAVDTTAPLARSAGLLLRLSRDSAISVVDAHVVQHALALDAAILTTDPNDIQRLLDAAGAKNPVFQLPWPV